MSGTGSDVVEKPQPQGTSRKMGSKVSEEVLQEQKLLNAQNDFFFQTLGFVAVTNATSSKDKKKITESNKKKLATYTENQKKQQEAKVLEVKLQTQYEDRLVKFSDMLDKLWTGMPVTGEACMKMRSARSEARRLAALQPPDYAGALKQLNDSGIEDALKKMPKQLEDTKRKCAGQAPESFRLEGELQQKLAGAALSDDVVETFKEKIRLVMTPVMSAKDDVTAKDGGVKQELAKVFQEVVLAIQASEKAKQQYDELKKAGTGLTKLSKAAPGVLEDFTDTTIAELGRQRQNAAAAYDRKDYPLALEILQGLAKQCEEWDEKLQEEKTDSRNAWKAKAGAIDTALQKAEAIGADNTTPAPLAEKAKKLAGQLGELKALRPASGSPCWAAIEQFEAAQQRLDELVSRNESAGKFAGVKDGLIKPNDDLLQTVESALGSLEQTLTQRHDIDEALREKTLAPLRERLQAIKSGWGEQKTAAYDEDSLGAADVATALGDLQGDIADVAEPSAIDELAKSPALDKARSDLEAAFGEADKVILKVLSYNPEAGMEFRAAIQDYRKMMASYDDPELLNSVREQLTKEMAKQNAVAQFADQRISELREQIDKLVEPVLGQLTTQGNAIGKMRGGKERDAYTEMQATLQTEYHAILAMRDSDQINVLEQALADAKDLAEESTNFAKELDGTLDVEKYGYPNALSEAIKLHELIMAQLTKDKLSQQFMAVTYADLQDKLTKAQENIGKSMMAGMMRELHGIWVAMEAMHEKAVAAQKQFEAKDGFKELYADIQKLLKDERFVKNAPNYVKKATAELKALEGNAQFEGGYADATADATKMKIKLAGMLASAVNPAGVPVLIADQEQTAADEAKKKELQKAKWEAEVEIIEKELKEALKFNEKDVKGLKTIVKDTKKAIKKSEDYATGRDQLQMVRTKLALIKQNPNGLMIVARNKLPLVNRIFRKAVMQFDKGLKTLETAVQQSDLHDEGKEIVAKQIIEVRSLLNPAAFTKHIAKMTKPDLDERAKSTAREKALREARKMMKYVKKDYRMRALHNSPFVPEMKGLLSKVFLALLNVENNMLVSL